MSARYIYIYNISILHFITLVWHISFGLKLVLSLVKRILSYPHAHTHTHTHTCQTMTNLTRRACMMSNVFHLFILLPSKWAFTFIGLDSNTLRGIVVEYWFGTYLFFLSFRLFVLLQLAQTQYGVNTNSAQSEFTNLSVHRCCIIFNKNSHWQLFFSHYANDYMESE